MYLLKRFLGERFARINAILDLYGSALTSRINLIASASYPFEEVVDALANPFHVFPCEGLPGARYFPGASALDEVELSSEVFVRRLLRIGEEYRVTIQPHSGTQANHVVFNSVLDANDSVVSLAPSHGGHISHSVLIGRRNPVHHYHATSQGIPDYEEVASLARTVRPKLIVAGSSSLAKAIDYEILGTISRDVGAFLHADASHSALYLMTGHHSHALPHADFLTFNTMKNLRGPSGGTLVYRSGLHSRVSRALFPGTQGGPLENVLFAKLVCFAKLLEIDLAGYAGKIIANAKSLAAVLQNHGYCLVGEGTDSHIVMLDLRDRSLTGLDAERLCEIQGILINRNLVPDDHRPPWIASGVRMGTACATILGYSETDIETLGGIIHDILSGVTPSSNALESLIEKQKLVAPVWR